MVLFAPQFIDPQTFKVYALLIDIMAHTYTYYLYHWNKQYRPREIN